MPAAQDNQLDLLGLLYVPATQVVHVDDPDPLASPRLHGVQDVDPTDDQVPAGQFNHVD